MKALILAAGKGSRIGDYCKEENKCLLKVRGKPLIENSLQCTAGLDLSEILIVVGHRAEKIIKTYGYSYKGKSIKYVFQLEQRGLVYAIECARETLNGEDFMLMLGDEIMINPRHSEMIKKYYNEKLFSLCGVSLVEDKNLIKKTYAVTQRKNGRILRLIEKPRVPINNIMGTGNCIFQNKILSYLDKTPVNPKRGEKELVDLIQCAINDGHKVKSFPICDKYFNINCQDDFQEASYYFFHS